MRAALKYICLNVTVKGWDPSRRGLMSRTAWITLYTHEGSGTPFVCTHITVFSQLETLYCLKFHPLELKGTSTDPVWQCSAKVLIERLGRPGFKPHRRQSASVKYLNKTLNPSCSRGTRKQISLCCRDCVTKYFTLYNTPVYDTSELYEDMGSSTPTRIYQVLTLAATP